MGIGAEVGGLLASHPGVNVHREYGGRGVEDGGEGGHEGGQHDGHHGSPHPRGHQLCHQLHKGDVAAAGL